MKFPDFDIIDLVWCICKEYQGTSLLNARELTPKNTEFEANKK
jgi:hypothetical protein